MAQASYDIILRDRNLKIIGQLWPVEGVAPVSRIQWTRSWRDPGELELVIHRNSPLASALLTLANFIEVRRNGVFEAVYILLASLIPIGSITYEQAALEHINAIFMAGQGEGTKREVVLRIDPAAVTRLFRFEEFVDRRDIALHALDQLRSEADARLQEAAITTFLAADIGMPRGADEEVITVSGRDPLFFLQRRIVIPPPATTSADGVVNISTAEAQKVSQAADVAMKTYVNSHAVAPTDANRIVPNLRIGPDLVTPLPSLSVEARFLTVHEIVRDIAQRANAGISMTIVDNSLEFQVAPERDRTGLVEFRDSDVLLDVPGRAYRTDWDLGDKVKLTIEPLGISVNATIREVKIELAEGKPDKLNVAFNKISSDPLLELVFRLRQRQRQTSAGRL